MKLSADELRQGAVNLENKIEKKSVQNIIKAFENSVYADEDHGKTVANIFLKVSLFLTLEHSDSLKDWADTVSLNVMRIGDSLTEEGVDVIVEAEGNDTRH